MNASNTKQLTWTMLIQSITVYGRIFYPFGNNHLLKAFLSKKIKHATRYDNYIFLTVKILMFLQNYTDCQRQNGTIHDTIIFPP